MIGYALCGSYCTHEASVCQLERLVSEGYEVMPIVSENVYKTDTRFGRSEDLISRLEEICKREAVHTIVGAEPLGPKISLDAMIISPCTGTLLQSLPRELPIRLSAWRQRRICAVTDRWS